MNEGAIAFGELEKSADFYRSIEEKFQFPVISDIEDYMMAHEWFYDSNYHLNESGMKVRTVRLVNDIKNNSAIRRKRITRSPINPFCPIRT